VAEYIRARFVTLGTDGFGRSDTRQKMRSFFEVDRYQIVLAALQALAEEGRIERKLLVQAIKHYGIAPAAQAPWNC